MGRSDVASGERFGRLDRRQFLRRAGGTGALLTLPGLAAACGGGDDDGGSGGGGGGGGGDAVKIGYVTPSTGALAAFAAADDYTLTTIRDLVKGGIKTANGTRQVEIIVKDSQSNPDRAGTVASDLILKDGVDLVVVASTPETTNPVSDQCELNGMPCISTMAPWQSWFFPRKGDPNKPFQFTYHFFWGLEDLTATYVDMWGQVDSNKTVGALWPNDGDGNAFADKKTGFPPVLSKAGFKLVDPGRYEDGSNDFSAQISRFKSGNADILTGVPIPPDFTNFYKQASQQGFRPPIVTVAKALLFDSSVDALGGNLGENLSTEVWWTPDVPFKSSLNGNDAKQLADGYEQASGKGWTQPIGYVHALFEVALDVLKRADPKDKDSVVEAITATDVQTIVGPVSWKSGPVKNVAKAQLSGGQWRKADSGWDLEIVSNKTAPDIETTSEMKLIES
jgi:branched-chain amino acid transport system substrate-binding protein